MPEKQNQEPEAQSSEEKTENVSERESSGIVDQDSAVKQALRKILENYKTITGIVLTSAALAYGYSTLNKTSTDAIQIATMNQNLVTNAEQRRQNLETEIKERVSTLLVLNTETGTITPLFVATRFMTQYQPAKAGIQGVDDFISQDNSWGDKYTKTLSMENVYIERDLGDLEGDANDYRIIKKEDTPRYLANHFIIASYHPELNNGEILTHNKRVDNNLVGKNILRPLIETPKKVTQVTQQ